MQPTVAELAEDPAVHLLPRPGFELVDRGEYVFEAARHRASVQRLRLGHLDTAVAWVREECVRRQIGRCEWWVGWNATPADLAQRLTDLGFVPDDEEATLTGMSIDREPPAAPDVEVRRIETLDQQLAALEVDWDVWNLPEPVRVSRRAYEHERFVADGNRPPLRRLRGRRTRRLRPRDRHGRGRGADGRRRPTGGTKARRVPRTRSRALGARGRARHAAPRRAGGAHVGAGAGRARVPEPRRPPNCSWTRNCSRASRACPARPARGARRAPIPSHERAGSPRRAPAVLRHRGLPRRARGQAPW